MGHELRMRALVNKFWTRKNEILDTGFGSIGFSELNWCQIVERISRPLLIKK